MQSRCPHWAVFRCLPTCKSCQAGDKNIDPQRWSRTVMLLQGINALPRGMALPVMSQEAIVLAFRKLFPGGWFSPWWRTLSMGLPSQASPTGSLRKEKDGMDPWSPTPGVRQVATHWRTPANWGCLPSGSFNRAARFNLEPEDHFQQALKRAQQPLPFRRDAGSGC